MSVPPNTYPFDRHSIEQPSEEEDLPVEYGGVVGDVTAEENHGEREMEVETDSEN